MDALFQEGREGACLLLKVFFGFVGCFLEQSEFIDLPVLTGEDLHATVLATKSSSGGLDGWGWNDLKPPPPPPLPPLYPGMLGLSWVLILDLLRTRGRGVLACWMLILP